MNKNVVKKFQIEKMEDYNKVYTTENVYNFNNSTKEATSIKLYDKKEFEGLKDDAEFIAEYKKSRKDKTYGTFAFNDVKTQNSRTLNCYRYKTFNRFLNKEVGYAKVKDRDNSYIVFIKGRILPLLLSLMLIASLLIGGFALISNMQNNNTEDYEIVDTLPDIEELDKEKLQKFLNEQVNENRVNVSINTTLTFINGECPNANILNNKNNKQMQRLTYYLSDNTQIAQTAYIKPGAGVAKLKLDKDIKKGTFDGYVYVDTFQKNEDGKLVKTGTVTKQKVMYIVK